MAKREVVQLQITGKLTGVPMGTDLPPATYIYQKTTPALANAVGLYGERMQIRRHVPQVNPNTPAQAANRSKFAAGVASWHALTPTQKEGWRAPGILLGLNRFQAYMRNYMRAE